MRRAGSIVVACCLLSGCQTARQAWISTGVGVAAAGGGLVLVAASRDDDEPPILLMSTLVVGGGLVAIISAINAIVLGTSNP